MEVPYINHTISEEFSMQITTAVGFIEFIVMTTGISYSSKGEQEI